MYIRPVMSPVSSRRLVALLLVAACIMTACGVQTVRVVGDAMSPTFHDGDVRIANTAAYDSTPPKRGDIVLFKESGERIARVVGLPGETVAFAAGVVLVNGSPLREPYLPAGTQSTAPQESYSVPAGEYFVLNDNRARITDSRTFGSIPRSAIEGKIG
jgi:signal peptidase I